MASRRHRAAKGRGGVALCRLMDAALDFAHEDGATETIELGGIGSAGLPSLLRWDVLRHFRLDLNPSRGSVSLLPP